jgi:hypothetical protein
MLGQIRRFVARAVPWKEQLADPALFVKLCYGAVDGGDAEGWDFVAGFGMDFHDAEWALGGQENALNAPLLVGVASASGVAGQQGGIGGRRSGSEGQTSFSLNSEGLGLY